MNPHPHGCLVVATTISITASIIDIPMQRLGIQPLLEYITTIAKHELNGKKAFLDIGYRDGKVIAEIAQLLIDSTII